MFVEFGVGVLAGLFLSRIRSDLRRRKKRLDLAVLSYLEEHGESFPLDLLKAGVVSGGAHVRLSDLEEEGLVSSRLVERDPVDREALQAELARRGIDAGQLSPLYGLRGPAPKFSLTERGRALLRYKAALTD